MSESLLDKMKELMAGMSPDELNELSLTQPTVPVTELTHDTQPVEPVVLTAGIQEAIDAAHRTFDKNFPKKVETPTEVAPTERQIAKIELAATIGLILTEHEGLESNVPFGHVYWKLVNELRGMR
jgi:hypothetical protein